MRPLLLLPLLHNWVAALLPYTMWPCLSTWKPAGNGFGNVDGDRTFLDLQAAAPFAANISGPMPVTDGPKLINAAHQAEATSLFAPCSRRGAVQAQVLRQGVVSQGGDQPLGLAFPALAVAPGSSGELLLTFSYSGPGDVAAGTAAAFLGG